MQKAHTILQAVHKLGVKGLPLTRGYRNLYSEDLYLTAYSKIYRNNGALTVGSDAADTIDGMSLSRIQRIIGDLRTERYRFRPVRRVEIPKRSGTGTRPLGVPNFTDKLVQEVLRMLLEAYYEPRFRASSHGYRPGRGCHTALENIKQSFRGAAWFIEGDIKGCFDHIDHEILMGILARDIHDQRLLKLIRQSLEAGVLRDWQYERTYSGTPQGGILSPLLSNIYLHELDRYIEDTLMPEYTCGEKRRIHPEYKRYEFQLKRAREQGDATLIHNLEQARRQYPSQDMHDPHFRRLKYVRYADDFILAYIGTRAEAETIKDKLGEFLQRELHLQLSPQKTLITPAKTQFAQFLGYTVSIYRVDDKLTPHPHMQVARRSINGHVRLGVPAHVIARAIEPYRRNGKSISQAGLLMFSEVDILHQFQQRFKGLADYYQYAVNRCSLQTVKRWLEQSLVKTLAHKRKISVSQVYRRYRGTREVNDFTYRTLQITIPTPKGERTFYWGAIPLRVVPIGTGQLHDTRYQPMITNRRSDLLQRLHANQCELCGATDHIEVHHIRKLADLKQRWRGRPAKPAWVIRMITMQRKTLMVCRTCHDQIHSGKLNTQQST